MMGTGGRPFTANTVTFTPRTLAAGEAVGPVRVVAVVRVRVATPVRVRMDACARVRVRVFVHLLRNTIPLPFKLFALKATSVFHVDDCSTVGDQPHVCGNTSTNVCTSLQLWWWRGYCNGVRTARQRPLHW